MAEAFKYSRQIKKEREAKKRAKLARMSHDIRGTFNNIKNKLRMIEKSGAIPDEDVLMGYRKRLQHLSSCLRKIRSVGLVTPFNQGHINLQIGKINKWMTEGTTGTGKVDLVRNKSKELADMLTKLRPGLYQLNDPPIRGVIKLLREIARDRVLSQSSLLIAGRALRLRAQRKRTEAEVEDYLKEKIVVPALSDTFKWFRSELEIAHISFDETDMHFIETGIKGGKALKDYLNILSQECSKVSTRVKP